MFLRIFILLIIYGVQSMLINNGKLRLLHILYVCKLKYLFDKVF